MEFDTGTMVLPITYTKGLEFDCCILMNPDTDAYPACDANVKLLYVAATRALHELAVYHTGTLTPLIAEPIPDSVRNAVFDAENMQPNRVRKTVTFSSIKPATAISGEYEQADASAAGTSPVAPDANRTTPAAQMTDLDRKSVGRERVC